MSNRPILSQRLNQFLSAKKNQQQQKELNDPAPPSLSISGSSSLYQQPLNNLIEGYDSKGSSHAHLIINRDTKDSNTLEQNLNLSNSGGAGIGGNGMNLKDNNLMVPCFDSSFGIRNSENSREDMYGMYGGESSTKKTIDFGYKSTTNEEDIIDSVNAVCPKPYDQYEVYSNKLHLDDELEQIAKPKGHGMNVKKPNIDGLPEQERHDRFDLDIKAENEYTNLSPRIKVADILGVDKSLNHATSPRSSNKHYKVNKTPMKSRSPNSGDDNQDDTHQTMIKCSKHKDEDVIYICLKDNCGELLCSQCILLDHTNQKHIGIYKKLIEYVPMYKAELENEQIKYKDGLTKTISHIQKLDSLCIKDNNMNMMLTIIEENVIRTIKQYFKELKGKMMDVNSYNALQEAINDLQGYKHQLNDQLAKIDKYLKTLEVCLPPSSASNISSNPNPGSIINFTTPSIALSINPTLSTWSTTKPSIVKENFLKIYEMLKCDNPCKAQQQHQQHLHKLQAFDERMKALEVNTTGGDKQNDDKDCFIYVDAQLDQKLFEFLGGMVCKKHKENEADKDGNIVDENSSEQYSMSNRSEGVSAKNEELLVYYQNLYKQEQKSMNSGYEEEKVIMSSLISSMTKSPNDKKAKDDHKVLSPKTKDNNSHITIKNDLKKQNNKSVSVTSAQTLNTLSSQHQSQNIQPQAVMAAGDMNRNVEKTIVEDLHRAKTNSPIKEVKLTEHGYHYQGLDKISKVISHSLINTYMNLSNNISEPLGHLHDKDLDASKMRVILVGLYNHYKSQKIKIFDSSFLPNMLNIEEILHIDDIDINKVQYDNIKDLLYIPIASHASSSVIANTTAITGITSSSSSSVNASKYKSIFQIYERLFFPVYISNQQWLLVEIKISTKSIIAYDILHKLNSKNKLIDNLLSVFQELVKHEYKSKLNQILDINTQWEKKKIIIGSSSSSMSSTVTSTSIPLSSSSSSALIIKSLYDTGIILIKIISCAFQNKEFNMNSINNKEMNIVKKKIEQYFKYRDDHHLLEKILPY